MDDPQLRNKMVRDLKEIQAKHTYFLMAAACASLGFGVQKLDGQLPGPFLFLGLAGMALWIVSFAIGCFAVERTQALLSTNFRWVDCLAAERFDLAEEVLAKAQGITKTIRYLQWCQLAALAIGVVLFAVWRVVLIYHPPYVSNCIP